MSSFHQTLAVVLFAFTYCFLAFEKLPFLRLDRAGGVLVGAVSMVALGVLSFDEAWQSIDGQTIVLLTGMMILNVFLEESGFFGWIASRAFAWFRSPIGLLVALVFVAGGLSALFLNDTVCLMLTLPLVRLLDRARLPRLPYVIALAMGTNVGSVMTIVGNPQNMLIHVYSGYGYVPFASRMLPVGLVGLGLLTVVLIAFYGRALRDHATRLAEAAEEAATEVRIDAWLLGLTLVVLAGVLVGFVVTSQLALVAISGAAVLLVASRRPAHDVLARVDWILLVFFVALFVVMEGIAKTGLLERLSDLAKPIYGTGLPQEISVFSTLTVVASNLVSNVPFVILARDLVGTLRDPGLIWLVLSMASTFAGNLTIPGSVATLIVLRLAGPAERVGFLQFSKVGIPVTILTTAAGAALLAWMGAPASTP